jgi:hypothetical protein
MAPNDSITESTPDSGAGRTEDPGAEAQNSNLTTQDESLAERAIAESLYADSEGEVADSDNLDEILEDIDDFEATPALHETDLHTVHSDHDGDSADAANVIVDWDDGILDLRSLSAPAPNTGMVQRWVKLMEPDGTIAHINWGRKHRLGWRPRSVQSLPARDRNLPTERHANIGEVIQVAGLVLCEMEAARYRKIREAIRQRADEMRRGAIQPAMSASQAGRAAGWGAGIEVDQDRTQRITRRQSRGR